MNILLLSPPHTSAVHKVIGATGPPLGLAYLASMVREEHTVKIVDAAAQGLDRGDVRRIIKAFDPQVVGITATTSMMMDAYRMAAMAKQVHENCWVVIGGPHVSFTPEKTLQECPSIDIVVRGEGEATFSHLVEALAAKAGYTDVAGISFTSNGRVVHNPPRRLIQDIDDLPFPSYDLLPMDRYQLRGEPFGAVITSRGCPFNCTFCSSSLQFGKQWRSHSPQRIVEELSFLHDEYGKKEIEFLDDTFTLDQQRVHEIADLIQREGLDISWSASSRVDTFPAQAAHHMAKAGCHTVYFGIESGSQKTLNAMGKGITLQQSVTAVHNAQQAGLSTLGSFIIGFPDEDSQDVNTTIRFSKKVGVDLAQFTIATPYPGTRLWRQAWKEGLLLTFDWQRFTSLQPVMKLKHFTATQIKKMLVKAYTTFYLRPKMVVKDIIRDQGFMFRKALSYLFQSFRRSRSRG